MKALRPAILPLLPIAGATVAAPVRADHHLMQIERVIGGVNGDHTAQAI